MPKRWQPDTSDMQAILGLAPEEAVTLRTGPDPEGGALEVVTARRVYRIRIPYALLADADFDLYPWLLDRLREQRDAEVS